VLDRCDSTVSLWRGKRKEPQRAATRKGDGRLGRPPRSPVTLAGDGASRFFSFAPPETHGRSTAVEHGYPHPAWLSWSLRPLQRFWCHASSALLASSAPPSPFETASGSFSCNFTSWTQGPGRSSRGVRFPFRAELRLGCPGSGASLPLARSRRPGRARESPLLGFCLPSSTSTSAAPVAPTTTSGPKAIGHSRECEGYQALTGAVLRVLAPLDGFSCARGTHGTPSLAGRRSPFAVTLRRFAVLFHTARAHWSRPSELSLLEEPYPLSQATSPLWVRADRPTTRSSPRVSRLLSPFAPASCHSSPGGALDCKVVTTVSRSR